jgi:cytochrome c biogenesis protein CcdA
LVIAGGDEDTSRSAALTRAAAATVVMSAGFVTVFGVFGLLISPLIATAQKYLPFATVVIGVLLIALAVWLLAGKEIAVLVPKLSGGAPTARLGSMYAYGVAYAVASLSCTVAPFLAVITASFTQGSALTVVLAFVTYAGGMALTVGVAAIAVALAGASAVSTFRRLLPHIGRIVGAVVLLTGLYVTYYGYYEIRLFFTDAGPDDPIIQAASRVQGWLASQVNALGAWPLLGILVALVLVGAGRRVLARRRARIRHTPQL